MLDISFILKNNIKLQKKKKNKIKKILLQNVAKHCFHIPIPMLLLAKYI